MNKKIISTALALGIFGLTACGGAPSEYKNIAPALDSESTIEVEIIPTALDDYNEYVTDPSTIPVSFAIGDRGYHGFGKDFDLYRRVRHEKYNGKIEDTLYFKHDSGLDITVYLAAYPSCNAYEWTVYFENNTSRNSEVLRDIAVVETKFDGDSPRLKGIYGDVSGNYASYDFDLTEENVTFSSTSGRPTDGVFPYYNLELDDGGYMMAVGWPGTWQADFVYADGVTSYKAQSDTGFESYLKPGETVRTALAAFVRYDERDEDKATNAWRKWYIEYNMPTERDGSTLKPIKTLATFNDYSVAGNIGHDISVYETTESMITGLNNAYSQGVEFDYFWVDAGWYTNVDGSSILSHSNWRTIGTWELDPAKFPNTLSPVDDLLESHGDKFLLWFEPEWNLLHNNVLFEQKTGFKTEWFLSGGGSSSIQLLNLANDDCYDWLMNRLCGVIRQNGVEYFRDDFNNDPAPAWAYNDFLQGKNRKGITENLYVQNHLRMWRELKETFPELLIDSCSSGGRRNDLETMRLAVPLHRTDMDYNSPNMRLSMSSNLFKWLPYFGSPAFLSNNPDTVSEYLMRAAYSCDIKLTFAWSSMSAQAYKVLHKCLAEYDIVKTYLYSDYYNLLPPVSVEESDAWSGWEFYDTECESGIVQIFRRNGSTESSKTVKIKGVDAVAMYELYDFDTNTTTVVSGEELISGITVELEREGSALYKITKKS